MLSVKHLKKNFGKNTVLKDISLDVSVGDIIATVFTLLLILFSLIYI